MAATETKTNPLSPSTGVSTVQQQLTGNLNAANAVTSYAHGVVNTSLKPVTTPPKDWFTTLSNQLATAQGNAQNWLTSLGPSYGATIPTSIINYGNTFTVATNDILQLLASSNNNPSPDQLKQISQIFSALLDALNKEETQITTLQQALRTFATAVEQDNGNFASGAAAVKEAEDADDTLETKLQSTISGLKDQISTYQSELTTADVSTGIAALLVVVSFVAVVVTGGAAAAVVVAVAVDLTVAGGIAIAEFNDDIDLARQQIAQDTQQYNDTVAQVSALKTLNGTLDDLSSANETAQTALTSLLTTWQGLQDEMKSVISELEMSESASGFLQQLDIQIAQQDWASLVQFAQSIINSYANTQVQVVPVGGKVQARGAT